VAHLHVTARTTASARLAVTVTPATCAHALTKAANVEWAARELNPASASLPAPDVNEQLG